QRESQSGWQWECAPGSRRGGQPGSQRESRRENQPGSAARGTVRRWKTVLEYVFGVAVLAAVLVLALTLPGLYTSWQDEQLLSTVTTDSRESISFIDTSSLDIAGRMQMLSQVTEITDAETILNYEEGSEEYTERYAICVEKLRQWVECGLLPEFVLEMATEENFEKGWCELGYVNTDQGMLSVYYLAFYATEYYETDDLTWDWTYGYLYVIMDAETDMIYLTELANDNGRNLKNCLANYIGYASYEEAIEQIWEAYQDGTLEAKQEDYSAYDIASFCGATSA
ncbi:MAG: hypothetical protein LUF30_03535, partial [Lachnospiraceae bacterium]|nr:hypothetical protein [Lachnospiraceae bacterium]